MLTWAADYWYLCVAALLIGFATAAWIWLGARTNKAAELDFDEAPSPRLNKAQAAPALEPVKPVIDVAQPVQFVAPAPTAAPPASADQGSASGDRPAIAAAAGDPDNLALIKGVGPKLNALLTALGVTRFDQIAAWNEADIAEVDRFLGTFKGRIARDNWVEQAGLLATGDHAAFAAKFGAVGSEIK